MTWRLVYTKQALKDAKHLKSAGLHSKAKMLLDILEENPYTPIPPFKKLSGSLEGACSRRLNIQHRLIYQVYELERMVKILRLWTHYE